MTVWMLDGDDAAVADHDEVTDGDLVVRRADEQVRVGVARPAQGPPVDWRAEVDLALLPGGDRLGEGDGASLRRVDDVDGLERALSGVLTAERDRGA